MLNINTCVIIGEQIGYIVDRDPTADVYDIELEDGAVLVNVERSAFILFGEVE